MQNFSRRKQYLADFGLVLVAAVWGGGFVAVKDGLNQLTPMVLMAFRFTLASLMLYVCFNPWLKRISLSNVKRGGLTGLILFMAFAFQTIGLQYTTASKQGFLTATYVVMVPFLYWGFYRKRPKVRVFIGSGAVLIGIAIMSLTTEGFNLGYGDVLTLICALFFALHILALEKFTPDVPMLKLAFIQVASAALFFIVAALIFESLPTFSSITLRTWSAVIYSALFSTFFCFTLQTIAQRYTTSAHAALILSLESLFAAIFGVLFLGEILTPIMLVGCGLIFIAILGVELENVI